MKYKISVIIPAYNMEKYIRKSINSIIEQDLINLEVIVVNDGSTDHTLDIVNEMISNDQRIKIVSIDNHGVSYARNIGIEESNGEYILFLDADDWIERNSLNSLYTFAKDNELDLVNFGFKTVKNINTINSFSMERKNYIVNNIEALKMLFLDKMKPSSCNKLIKKKFLLNNKFNEKIYVGEDLVFTTNLLANCKTIGLYNKDIYNYYYRVSSVTNTITEKILTIKDALLLVENSINSNNLYKYVIEEFEFLKFKHLYFYRVIVGSMPDKYHKNFYLEYIGDYKNIKNNCYYQEFYKKSKLSTKLRIFIYEKNYSFSRIFHKFILKIL